VKESELFEILGELAPDPAVALAPLTLPPYSPDPGPLHKVQFVIELVGKALIHQSDAQKLLDKRSKAAMGEPLIFAMAPGWKRWQLLTPTTNEKGFDSLCFAWDFVARSGNTLSRKSATELLRRASEIAFSFGRKAVPLRPEEDVDTLAKFWKEFKDGFDAGVSCYLDPVVDGIDTACVMREAYRLGFRLNDKGQLEWRTSAWPTPLLSLDPAGSDTVFNPSKRPSVPGISIGYSLPRSPNPLAALEAMFTAIDHLAQTVGGTPRDEDGELLDEPRKAIMRELVQGATQAMKASGAGPGSQEAMRLFQA